MSRFNVSISSPNFIEWSFHFAIQAAKSLKWRLRNVCVAHMATSEMHFRAMMLIGIQQKVLSAWESSMPLSWLLSTLSKCTRMRRKKLWAAALKAVPGLDERTWRFCLFQKETSKVCKDQRILNIQHVLSSRTDCASGSAVKAVNLAPRIRPSLGCLEAVKQRPLWVHDRSANEWPDGLQTSRLDLPQWDD